MPNLFSKHLHLCFFKPTNILSQPDPHHPPPSTFHFNTTFTHDDDNRPLFSDHDSDSPDPAPPDFASVFASQRFFFSSPGSSNSIIESTDTRPVPCDNSLIPIKGAVNVMRVPKYSVNPYVDFLRSMQEMIQSHQALDATNDWDYLQQLLLCYLALNPTHTHKYILRAFTHLLVDLLSSSSSSSFSSSSSSSSPPCRLHPQGSFSARLS